MNILVTGGAGFIGSHVVDAYVEKGYRVIVVDDLSSGKRENVNPRAEFYHLSIGDPRLANIIRENSIDVLNHHAAQKDVRKSVEDPGMDARINVVDTINLLEFCRKNGVKKAIFASTGGAIYGEPEYLPADENHPVKPVSPYGISKFAAEKYLEFYKSMYNLNFTILRYSNVYGPRQDPEGEAGVVAIFSKSLLEGKQCSIFGDGEQTRDYIHVSDIARVNLEVLDKAEGEIFNIGTGKETSVNQLYRKMCSILNCSTEPIYKEQRPGEINRISLKIDRVKESIGWEPRVDLETGLKDTLDYFKRKAALIE